MNRKLSLDDFKRWMSEHEENHSLERPRVGFVGVVVESKVSRSKLIEKMVVERGDMTSIAELFLSGGGIVEDVNDKTFTIQVQDNQSFSIHRCYVKRA